MRKRVDANQTAIVAAIRKAGGTVQSLAAVGKGCPDLLVGLDGVNYLFEVKDGKLPPSKQQLTAHETRWLNAWRGRALVVSSAEAALVHMGLF